MNALIGIGLAVLVLAVAFSKWAWPDEERRS